MYWMLAREVLYIKGQLKERQSWDVMVDSFFWRDPEELERQEKEAAEQAAGDQLNTAGDNWDEEHWSGAVAEPNAAW